MHAPNLLSVLCFQFHHSGGGYACNDGQGTITLWEGPWLYFRAYFS